MSTSPAITTDLGLVLDIATTLRELTSESALLTRIPQMLSSSLDLGPVTFALSRQDNAQSEPTIMSLSTSLLMSNDPASADLTRTVLGHLARAESAVAPTADTASPSERVFFRRINRQHAMMLIMHQPLAAPERLELVNLLVSHLSKALFASLSWQVYPTPLGEPFTTLTEREWVVLCGLRSDDGEKQLADRLRLSPHTLHSHIKSIYRKMGVQGRLPLLQRLDAAILDYRVKVFSGLASGNGAQLDRLAG